MRPDAFRSYSRGMSIPVVPRVLQDLQLARRACAQWSQSGELIELWEGYRLAQLDPAILSGSRENLRRKLEELRQDTIPLVEYLRQTLPVSLEPLADPSALDLALVFIMTTPPARDAVVRWFKNPSGSRDEAIKVLKTVGRMVETYRQALESFLRSLPERVVPEGFDE